MAVVGLDKDSQKAGEMKTDLAAQIAKNLFTNGKGERAVRLCLELSGEQYGGGWCEAAVADVIRKEIKILQGE